MTRPNHGTRGRSPRLRHAFATTVALGAAALLAGCKLHSEKPPAPQSKYRELGKDANLPAFLKGTVKDLTVVSNTGTFPVNSFGLVTGLRGTGDSTAPTLVRDWMIKEMVRHGIGQESRGYGHLSPDQMLNDPRVAVVGVVANIPPGARRGDRVDVAVQAMPGNNTTSLANGMLWRTSLRINGVADPTGAVNEYAKAQGNIFVNPAYAIGGGSPQGAALASLRYGTVPNGGIVTTDRAIHLILRSPSWSTSQAIERRLDQAFQSIADVPKKNRIGSTGVAEAQDEGYVHLYVPKRYRGDWEHFVGVARNLYMNSNPAFLSLKAKELADEAVKPGAPLMDISYAWEGIGPSAIPFITPLLSHPQQDVQFAAARAASFLGDSFGEDALLRIAQTKGHEFQVNAVQTLGTLPSSAMINSALAQLLSADEQLVRIEAYKVLARNEDPRIFSKVIHSAKNPDNEFTLDLIDAKGPPLVYCTRTGRPRVAVFGRKVSLQTPLVFAAFDSRLTISSTEMSATQPASPTGPLLNVFYREEGKRQPTKVVSRPDVAELIVRLGGGTEEGFHFSYGDIVAILQSLADKKSMPATFALEQGQVPELREDATPNGMPPQSRPQGDTTAAATSKEAEISGSLPDLAPMPAAPKDNKKKTSLQPGQESPTTISGPGASARPQ